MEKDNKKTLLILWCYSIATTSVTTWNLMNVENHYIFLIGSVAGFFLLYKIFKQFHDILNEE